MDKNKCYIGEKVKVTVTSIARYGAFVNLENGETGLIHISEISDSFISDISQILPVNSTVEAIIIGDGNKPHTYRLSIKRISRRTRQKTSMAKPLTRKQFNKEKIDSISFSPVEKELPEQIKREYIRLTGGNNNG
ncbi:MAG: S1 RNA-binding domain-containing protein [Bacilli bacterium]